jgi:hypothetical protein
MTIKTKKLSKDYRLNDMDKGSCPAKSPIHMPSLIMKMHSRTCVPSSPLSLKVQLEARRCLLAGNSFEQGFENRYIVEAGREKVTFLVNSHDDIVDEFED